MHPSPSQFLAARSELNAHLRRDREVCWSGRTLEMGQVAAMGNSGKLFHFNQASGWNALGVNETICEADDSAVCCWQ